MELTKHIKQLNDLIETYQSTPESDGGTLLALAQQISVSLYWLSEEKTREHKNFETYVFQLTTKEKMNVNRAINAAEVAFPNLYRLRYILRAGYSILDIIRSQVSYLKSERINTQ